MQGPVCTMQNFVCFTKIYVNRKAFLVHTIFSPFQNFLNCHQTSKMPWSLFGDLQFFVRQQNPLFLDSYPSSGHLVL